MRPLEMLDCVCQIHLPSINPRFFEAFIEQFPRWPYERMPREIFFVSGLLSHQQHSRRFRPFPKYGLRADLPRHTPDNFLQRFSILSVRKALAPRQ